MSQFNSEHLAEARAYNKMTGEELAGLIGVKKQAQNIASVAQRLRDYWGLGQEPIQDMISLMERNGTAIIISKLK